MVRGVHHVSVTVDDLDDAMTFYCGVLGCTQIPRPDLGVPGAWLRAGATEVHLIGRIPPRHGVAPGGEPPDHHVAFLVDDVDAAVARLRAAGVDVMAAPSATQAFVNDPSGNLVELASLAR